MIRNLKLLGFVAAIAGLLGFIAASSFLFWKREAATFNKFKRPDQPAATVWDAAFSGIRVTN